MSSTIDPAFRASIELPSEGDGTPTPSSAPAAAETSVVISVVFGEIRTLPAHQLQLTTIPAPTPELPYERQFIIRCRN
jgi:hypothetical protein